MILKKLEQEQSFKHNRLSGWVMFGLFFIIGLLSVGRVIAANRLVETSENLRVMDQQVQNLEAENQVLSEQVRVEESMTYVESKVAKMGFTTSPHYAFLTAPSKVAFLQ